MLIICPECELQVSDKAITCPHCGMPLQLSVKVPKQRKTKHRRLPNGFGQISKVSNPNMRKPYRAMVSVGKNPDTGRPICKLLKPDAYFATYNEAYEALVEYNKNPYDLDAAISVADLYKEWSEDYFKTLKNSSSARTIKSAWSNCSSVEKMRARDLRAKHIKGCMDAAESANMKSRVKSMFNLMLDYALENEIVTVNYARTFTVSDDILAEIEEETKSHISFTDEEMTMLWMNKNIYIVQMILIQCYMGWRPQELCRLKLEDIDLKKWTIKGGMKTPAGYNRVVPIHDRIKPIVALLYNRRISEVQFTRGEYLFRCTDARTQRTSDMTYDKYSYRYEKIIKELGLNEAHLPHDPRKQFVTMAKKYKVDNFAIKRIVGHKIDDITEAVYTDRDESWLSKEVSKIE